MTEESGEITTSNTGHARVTMEGHYSECLNLEVLQSRGDDAVIEVSTPALHALLPNQFEVYTSIDGSGASVDLTWSFKGIV